MTGYDIYKKAAARLGDSDSLNGILEDSAKLNIALEAINQIAVDLKLQEINSLSDDMTLDKKQTDALCSGVAMLIALSDGNSEKNHIYTGIYNAKRAMVLADVSIIEDKLPFSESGDI